MTYKQSRWLRFTTKVWVSPISPLCSRIKSEFRMDRGRALTLNIFRTPLSRKIAARSAALLVAAFGMATSFSVPAFAQGFARQDGSLPVPMDWSSKRVLFTADFTREQAEKLRNEPRAYAQWFLHGNAPVGSGLHKRPTPRRPYRQSRGD